MDRDIDVVVEANEKVETLLNDGHGNLSKLHAIELDKSYVLGLVDLNQDGRIDLICSGGWETSTLHGLVRYGNGQGAYSSPEDLVVQTSRNRGVWSWKWSRYGEAGNVARCADLNGDGRQDVVVGTGFVADGRKRDQLWMSSGSGGYIHEKLTAGGSAVYQLELGDFDLDGDIDIVSLDAATPTLRVFFNRATEPLEWNEVSISVRIAAWMSAFDLEGDGDLDILLSGDGLALLVNTTKP